MTWVTQEAEVITPQHQGQVEVKACTSQGCGACSLAGGCGQGLLSRWLLRRTPSFTLVTDIPLKTGDKVLLGLEATQLNKAALLQFLLPLLTLLAAAMLAEYLGMTTGIKLFLMALIGLSAGLVLARLLTRLLAANNPLKLLHRLKPSISPSISANNNRS